jgi:hypothetical protein
MTCVGSVASTACIPVSETRTEAVYPDRQCGLDSAGTKRIAVRPTLQFAAIEEVFIFSGAREVGCSPP